MELSKKAFKAYDIRGIVPGEVNAELAAPFMISASAVRRWFITLRRI